MKTPEIKAFFFFFKAKIVAFLKKPLQFTQNHVNFITKDNLFYCK